MKLNTLIDIDAKYSKYGGYESEWTYNYKTRTLLLAFQRYDSIDYKYVLFKNVDSYKFDGHLPPEYEELFSEIEKEAFLYELIDARKSTHRKFITRQISGGLLLIMASSFELFDRIDL